MRLARLLGKSIAAQNAEIFWKQVTAAARITDTTPKGTFVRYPSWTQLDRSAQYVDIFHTEFKQSLFDEVSNLEGLLEGRCLRVRGPSGVGKSHAQFAVMLRLYQQGRHRILFANCEKWFMANEYTFLKKSFEAAFAEDDEILEAIEKTDFSSFDEVESFLSDTVVKFLEKNSLQLVVSIDQFNNMPKEKIRSHPFSIILFMAMDNRFSRVRVVITYSITHFLAGHVQRDPLAEWCTFTWYSGLTDVEYECWWEKYSKSTFAQRGMEFASTLAELTGKYPLELYRAKRIIDLNPKITKEELYRQYIRQVTTYLETKTTEYITACLQSQIPNFLVLAGAPVLLAGIKKVTGNSALFSPTYMDGRFFFVNNDNDIQALTPTFAAILLSTWIKALGQSPILNPHIVGLMTQDKNCAGSLIDVLMREITKNDIVEVAHPCPMFQIVHLWKLVGSPHETQ